MIISCRDRSWEHLSARLDFSDFIISSWVWRCLKRTTCNFARACCKPARSPDGSRRPGHFYPVFAINLLDPLGTGTLHACRAERRSSRDIGVMVMLLTLTATVLILWLTLVLFFDPDGFAAARPRRSRHKPRPKPWLPWLMVVGRTVNERSAGREHSRTARPVAAGYLKIDSEWIRYRRLTAMLT